MLATDSGDFKAQDRPTKLVCGFIQTNVIKSGVTRAGDTEPVLSIL